MSLTPGPKVPLEGRSIGAHATKIATGSQEALEFPGLATDTNEMKWSVLEQFIPWRVVDAATPEHSLTCTPYAPDGWCVDISLPGKYWKRTHPPGGDFAISVTSHAAGWDRHTFSHVELFQDVQDKVNRDSAYMRSEFAPALARVVARGDNPASLETKLSLSPATGLDAAALLAASQCLALREHGRYKRYEPRGGRNLPARYAVGIIFGAWTAAHASSVQKRGLSGLLELHRRFGEEPTFESILNHEAA